MGFFPISLKVQGIKLFWSTIGQLGFQSVGDVVSQLTTIKKFHPVSNYQTIKDLTKAMSTLKWTEDPWNGKLDVIRHATYMQEAIDEHPGNSGDCDDYANYWIVALTKSNLATITKLCSALWVDNNKIVGHAICVYKDLNGWNWASNWNSCVPFKINDKNSWVEQMEGIINKKIIVAIETNVASVQPDDTVIYGKPVRIR